MKNDLVQMSKMLSTLQKYICVFLSETQDKGTHDEVYKVYDSKCSRLSSEAYRSVPYENSVTETMVPNFQPSVTMIAHLFRYPENHVSFPYLHIPVFVKIVYCCDTTAISIWVIHMLHIMRA